MPPSHQYNCRKLADFRYNSNLTFVTQAVALTVEPRKVVTVAHKQFLRIAAFKSNYWVESEDFSCFFAVITPSPGTSLQHLSPVYTLPRYPYLILLSLTFH